MPAAMLERTMVDEATVFGMDDASNQYTVALLGPFRCRLTPASQTVLGTGIGGVNTYYMMAVYPKDVTLPAGYWELECAGTRYTRRANSDAYFRDRRGNVLGKTVELDAIGAAPGR